MAVAVMVRDMVDGSIRVKGLDLCPADDARVLFELVEHLDDARWEDIELTAVRVELMAAGNLLCDELVVRAHHGDHTRAVSDTEQAVGPEVVASAANTR